MRYPLCRLLEASLEVEVHPARFRSPPFTVLVLMKNCFPVVFVLLLAACGESQPQPQFIAEEAVGSMVQCASLPSSGEAVADLFAVDDSLFGGLFGEERVLRLYDSSLNAVHTLRFDADGARGVRHPVSATVSDSLIHVADDARSLIRTFDWQGTDRGTVQLTFIPRRVRSAGGEVVVSPLVAGTMPSQLLFILRGQRAVPLEAPIARYEDIGLNTLANMAAITAFPHRFVVMHEHVVPFGYAVRTNGDVASIERIALPVPAAERDRLYDLPRERITEKNVNDLAIIAFAATEHRPSGRSFYVTRTGDGQHRPYRKIVVELDSLMQVQRAFYIDANPHHLAYLHSRQAVIAVDAEDRWFECPLPS